MQLFQESYWQHFSVPSKEKKNKYIVLLIQFFCMMESSFYVHSNQSFSSLQLQFSLLQT